MLSFVLIQHCVQHDCLVGEITACICNCHELIEYRHINPLDLPWIFSFTSAQSNSHSSPGKYSCLINDSSFLSSFALISGIRMSSLFENPWKVMLHGYPTFS